MRMSDQDQYIEECEGVAYVRGSRVPLESLIWSWREGLSAEEIREAYSTLTLSEVYGAIAYYLDHREAVDQQAIIGLAQYEAQRQAAEAADPVRYRAIRQRLRDTQSRHTKQSPAR